MQAVGPRCSWHPQLDPHLPPENLGHTAHGRDPVATSTWACLLSFYSPEIPFLWYRPFLIPFPASHLDFPQEVRSTCRRYYMRESNCDALPTNDSKEGQQPYLQYPIGQYQYR